MSLSLPLQGTSSEDVGGKQLCQMSHQGLRKTSRQQMTLNQMCDLIKSKLLGGHYYSIQNAFKVFSVQGKSLTVTKCALFRILCNHVPGLDLHHFNLILRRIHLDRTDLVSFHEFFSKFRVSSEVKNCRWCYPFAQHCKSDTWQFVHSQLREKAQNGLASFCSGIFAKQGAVAKTQFKRFLIDSSFDMSEDQFEYLWKRYDTEGKGWLSLTALLQRLGVDTPSTDSLTESILSVDGVKTRLLQHLKVLDTLKCGKVNGAQLCTALSKVGLNVTVVQVEELLQRLGLPAKGAIDYCKFLDFFVSRNEGSPVHLMLTNSRSANQKGSIEEAENSVIRLLQSKFLKLVASLRLHDAKNSGYIEKEDFRRCVRNLLPGKDTASLEDVITVLCDNAPHSPLPKVPYPKFLAMFESSKGPRCKKLSTGYPSVRNQDSPLSAVRGTVDLKLLEQITRLVAYDLSCLTRSFVELDDQNTGRLTLDQTLELLLKCGIVTTRSQLLPLWQRLLKNKDGTVNFQQFIKEFTNPVHKGVQSEKEDCLLPSRTLPRDVDVIVDKVRNKLMKYHDSLLKYFKAVGCSGCVSLHNFQHTIKKLCPAVTDSELNAVMLKYRVRQSALVDYEKMLSFFRPTAAALPCRPGNNLRNILSQQEQEPAHQPANTLPLAAKPNHGLPGTKGYLQKMLTAKWKELRRMFKNLDSTGSGFVSVSEFKSVLVHCGVQLTSEQYYHVLEALDPYLSGLVNYYTFINSIFQ